MRSTIDTPADLDAALVPAPGAPARDPLLCRAQGCPNRWTTRDDRGHELCSRHAAAPPRLWRLVTENQQRSAAEATALAAPRRPPAPPLADPTIQEAEIARARDLRERIAAEPSMLSRPKTWAHELRAREADKGLPARVLRSAWREVLGWPAHAGAADESWRDEAPLADPPPPAQP